MPAAMATVVVQVKVFYTNSPERAKADLAAMFKHLLSNRVYAGLSRQGLPPPHPTVGWDFIDTPNTHTRIKRIELNLQLPPRPPHA